MPPFILTLLSSGLRLVANAALVKGKAFIQEKTGVDLDQATISAEDQVKLRQFQAEHEEELLRLQLEDNKLGLEETKAFLADVADARKIQSEILMSANAPWYAKAIQPTLAAFTLLATILLFGMFVYWSGDITEVVDGKSTLVKRINDTQKDIIIYILGVLSAAVTQILGYYFGSSQGSASKSKSLDKVLAQTTSGAEK
ncbi:MAG: hypothetical protein EBY28_02605 [Betaproteobacteria bacterium]|nr:hypothetical protein [Betaproteobacteria bacterium]